MMYGPRWRSIVATWGGAAWLVLQQFGVPAASRRVTTGRDIVLVQESTRPADALERLPDGKILTEPLVLSCDQRLGEDVDGMAPYPFSAN